MVIFSGIYFLISLPFSRSLQLKVKELKADRERTLSEEQHSGERAPDPPEAEGKKKGAESPTRSTENAAADCASNGDIGRSCNESNSTGPKVAQDSDAATDRNPDGATVGAGSRDPAAADPITGDEEKLAGEGSYNGSSDTVAKGTEAATPADGPAATNPANQTDAGDSGESMAESKGEETSKEGSDVQSSASPSRRRFSRRTAASGVSSGGDDAEADEVSPPSKIIAAARSPPLAASFLETFRSSKLGCTFERRLESQVLFPILSSCKSSSHPPPHRYSLEYYLNLIRKAYLRRFFKEMTRDINSIEKIKSPPPVYLVRAGALHPGCDVGRGADLCPFDLDRDCDDLSVWTPPWGGGGGRERGDAVLVFPRHEIVKVARACLYR